MLTMVPLYVSRQGHSHLIHSFLHLIRLAVEYMFHLLQQLLLLPLFKSTILAR